MKGDNLDQYVLLRGEAIRDEAAAQLLANNEGSIGHASDKAI